MTNLQRALKALKLFGGEINGSFGETTVDAVNLFQRVTGQSETGEAAPALQTAIFEKAKAVRGEFGDKDYNAVISTVSNARAKVKVSSSLHLRQKASTSSKSLARMKNGTDVAVLERGSKWSKIQYGSKTGYAMNSYLTFYTQSSASLSYEAVEVRTLEAEIGAVLAIAVEPMETEEPMPVLPPEETVQPEATAEPSQEPAQTAEPMPVLPPEEPLEPEVTAEPSEEPAQTEQPMPVLPPEETVQPEATAEPSQEPAQTEQPMPVLPPETQAETVEPTESAAPAETVQPEKPAQTAAPEESCTNARSDGHRSAEAALRRRKEGRRGAAKREGVGGEERRPSAGSRRILRGRGDRRGMDDRPRRGFRLLYPHRGNRADGDQARAHAASYGSAERDGSAACNGSAA